MFLNKIKMLAIGSIVATGAFNLVHGQIDDTYNLTPQNKYPNAGHTPSKNFDSLTPRQQAGYIDNTNPSYDNLKGSNIDQQQIEQNKGLRRQ
jgi:hypothetical protein